MLKSILEKSKEELQKENIQLKTALSVIYVNLKDFDKKNHEQLKYVSGVICNVCYNVLDGNVD